MATSTVIPNMNPTGVIGSGSGNTNPGQQGTGFSTFTGTGGPGNMNYGNAANPKAVSPSANPYMAPSASTPNAAAPAASAPIGVSANASSGSATTGSASAPISTSSADEIGKIYGMGMGEIITNYLNSYGGYNSAITQQTIDAQTNAMQGQTALGANDLTSRLGASGVSGSSTEYSQALTGYEDQATAQQNAITSQEYYNMWNQATQNQTGMIESMEGAAGTYKANQFNWMDGVSLGLDVAGAVVGMPGVGSAIGGMFSGASGGSSAPSSPFSSGSGDITSGPSMG